MLIDINVLFDFFFSGLLLILIFKHKDKIYSEVDI